MIDLRSDTVTRPTAAMRDVLARAEVGDDVFGEDPSAQALEAEVARLTGKEAALFVSTGTMGNQLAIACQTRPGDEVLVGDGAHPVWYECGAGAVLSGVQFAVCGTGGLFTADEMEAQIKPAGGWTPRATLVCIENTHNRAGGRIFPQTRVVEIAARARARDLTMHLDGARIWNASAATGLSVAELCAPFATASVCFSKGLGAPAGSALAGPKAVIERARWFRKMWGGGMRQVGVLAAAALHALTHHRARLVEDHANALTFAEAVAGLPHAHVDLASIETNIVNVDLAAPLTADVVAKAARELGLAINPSGPRRLRAVTHLDVSKTQVLAAAELLGRAITLAAAAS
jgi:threonine aldolase